LEDRKKRITLDGQTLAVYVHVDDLAVASRESALARKLRDTIVRFLEGGGFLVTCANAFDSGRYIGLLPLRFPAGWRPADDKLATLSFTLDDLVTRLYVDVRVVSACLGAYIWFAMLWRPAMSVPAEMFRFIRTAVFARRRLSAVVRWELRMMRQLLPFLGVDLTRTAAPFILSQDAAGPSHQDDRSRGLKHGAWCLAASEPPAAEVDLVWSNLQCIGRAGQLPTLGGGPPSVLSDALSHVELPLIFRTLVPRSWIGGSVTWTKLLARRWRFPLDIGTGELRVNAMWPRLLARWSGLGCYDALALGDNQGAVGISTRGRSSRPWQNGIMRSWAAYEAISAFRLRSSWTPTWAQAADSGTRPASDGSLSIGKVLWPVPSRVVQLGSTLPDVRLHMERAGFAVEYFPRLNFGMGIQAADARRACRAVEANTTVLLLVSVDLSVAPSDLGARRQFLESDMFFHFAHKIGDDCKKRIMQNHHP